MNDGQDVCLQIVAVDGQGYLFKLSDPATTIDSLREAIAKARTAKQKRRPAKEKDL